MKKKLSKILVATLLICSVVGITPALATSVVAAPEAVDDGIVTPMADEFETVYRTYNGVLQYRIWNATQGYWVTPWINC